jgi:hypothetical protein
MDETRVAVEARMRKALGVHDRCWTLYWRGTWGQRDLVFSVMELADGLDGVGGGNADLYILRWSALK